LCGHYYPEVGRAFEDGFVILLERLGYRVWRKRDTRTGLDVVATFNNYPLFPEGIEHYSCRLELPIFSPSGVIAFSAKKGNFFPSDIEEIKEKIDNNDTVRINEKDNSIETGVIVTNYSKTEDQIQDILNDHGIYCWDISRLMLYSNKARISYNFSRKSSLKEYLIEDKSCSYLLCSTSINKGIMKISIIIFVDEHIKTRSLGADHMDDIMNYIYNNSLKPILDVTPLDLEINNELHVLDIIDNDMIDKAYSNYAGNMERHPKATYIREFPIYSYIAAPWFVNLDLSLEDNIFNILNG
jgi:hypothetical protein